MKAVIERTSRLLDIPLRPAPRGLLLAAALLLGATFFPPLWKVATFGPGAPRHGTSKYELLEPPATVETSDSSNEVTGPRDVPADFVEFKWIPFALGILGLLFLRAAVLGTTGTLVYTVRAVLSGAGGVRARRDRPRSRRSALSGVAAGPLRARR